MGETSVEVPETKDNKTPDCAACKDKGQTKAGVTPTFLSSDEILRTHEGRRSCTHLHYERSLAGRNPPQILTTLPCEDGLRVGRTRVKGRAGRLGEGGDGPGRAEKGSPIAGKATTQGREFRLRKRKQASGCSPGATVPAILCRQQE